MNASFLNSDIDSNIMDVRRLKIDGLLTDDAVSEALLEYIIDEDPEYWYAHFAMGRYHVSRGMLEEAIDDWIDAFDLMDGADFGEAFRTVADLLENAIISTLWRSLEDLRIGNIDDLAYVIFINFPEYRSEDTDLLIVLLKRLNKHLDDINHVRYLVDLLDTAEMIARKYFDMNVEIRTHMYAAEIVLGLGSSIILKSIPMLQTCGDQEEYLRTMKIVGEIVSMFTKLRDTIYEAVWSRSFEEVNSTVHAWSKRCTEPYMMHLERAFELSMMVHDGGKQTPEAITEERDREIERYVQTYFSVGHSSMNALSGSLSARHSSRNDA